MSLQLTDWQHTADCVGKGGGERESSERERGRRKKMNDEEAGKEEKGKVGIRRGGMRHEQGGEEVRKGEQ